MNRMDILVCLEGSASSKSAMEIAIATASELGATLVGLTVIDEPDIRAGEPTSIGGAAFKKDRDEALLADARAHAEEWEAAFLKRCSAAGVSARTLEQRGRPAKLVVEEIQRHHLTVLGRDVNFRFETHDRDRQ